MYRSSFLLSVFVVTASFTLSASSFFNDLNSITRYAHAAEQYPEPDPESDPLDFSFSGYHNATAPSLFMRILHYLGFYRSSFWNGTHFKQTLEEVTTKRIDRNLSGLTIEKITTDKPLRLYIWGDLEGAFHSLVRDITYLNKKGILSNNLIIKDPDTYFVFNGDAIDRSSHILDTLHLILVLMKQNPDRVIYVRGKHEHDNYWHNFGLKRELKIRAAYLEKSPLPLGKLVSSFFNTLPLALYINTQKKPQDVIRISHFSRENELIKEDKISSFLIDNLTIGPSFLHLDKGTPHETDSIDVKAIIKTEEWLKENRSATGLGLLDQDIGATAWSILSSPTLMSQRIFNFHYDAFAQLDVTLPIENSTITLIHRDIRMKEDFKELPARNIISGGPISSLKKSDKTNTFVIASTLSLIQGVPIMGERVKRGMDLCVNAANTLGDINNTHLRLIIMNDDYSPFKALQNVETLLQKNIRMLLLPTGTPTLTAYLDYVKSGELSVFFPVTGSPEFRDPSYQTMIHMRPTYNDEARALIEYVTKRHAVRKIAFFYQDDSYGLAPLKASHKKLQELGITNWIDIPYSRASISFVKQAEEILKAQPDALCFFSIATATQELLRQIGFEFLSTRIMFGISFLNEPTFRRYMNKHGLKIIMGAVVPNPQISSLPIVREYRELMDKNFYPYDVFSLESYIATSLYLKALKEVEQDPTNEKIMKNLESIKNTSFKGFNLDFNPKTRSLGTHVWIETQENEEWTSYPIQAEE